MATPAYNPDGSIPLNFNPNMGDTGANPTPQNPIEHLYKTELGRAPDAEGLSNWTNLYNTGMSLDDIRQQIGGSDEGQRFDINTMYREDLGRDADTGGLNSWLSALQGGMSLNDIRNQGIRASDEFINRQATPTYPSYPEPPVYTSPDRPDYPGEPPQYIRPDYPGEPPQYTELPNYPAGFDPITGTPITPRPAQIEGYGYGTAQQPFVFPNGFTSEMLDENGQVIGYRDPPRQFFQTLPGFGTPPQDILDAYKVQRSPFAGSVSNSPTNYPNYPNLPFINDPVNTTREEDILPKTPRSSESSLAGLDLLNSLFGNRPR